MATQGMQWPGAAQHAQGESRFMNGGSPRGGSDEGGRHSSRQPGGEEYKVYAANIPLTMTQESVEALFSKHGHVTSARVLPPKDGRDSTVAFIGFATEESASEAIDKLTGCELGECPPLRVMWPKKKEQTGGSGGGSSSSVTCHKCGEQGHYSRDCPNQQSQSGGRGCHKCGQEGHFARECTNQPTGGSPFGGSPFGGNKDQPRQSPFGGSRQEQPQQSPFGRSQDNNQQPQKSPFAGSNQSQPQANPFAGGNQNQLQSSPFAGGNQNQPQSSPFAGGNQNQPQASPFVGNTNQGVQSNNQGFSAKQTGYSNQQGDSFMSILGRGEILSPAPPTQPGGLQNYQPPSNQLASALPNQGYQQPPGNSYQQQPNQGSNQWNQSYQQGPANQTYQQSNQSRNQQKSYPQQSQGFGQQPSNGYQQPPGQDYQPNQNFGQQPNSGYQQPQSQGYQQYQGYGQQANQAQLHQGHNQQPQDNYQQQHSQSFAPPQPQPPQDNTGAQGTTPKSPFSAMNGPASGSPFGAKTSPFQPSKAEGTGSSFTARLPHSAATESQDRGGSPFGRSSGGGRSCHKCGEEGHFSRECPSQGGGNACHKCGQEGHYARDCPNQASRGGGSGCHKCGQEGHFARECPNQSSQGGGNACHKCGQEGHFARECPNQSSQGGGSGCHRCGEEGHFARECPNQPSQGGGSTCHKCGEVGHFARECPTGPSQGGACHKCGEVGHFARECPNMGGEFGEMGDPNRPAPVTYVPPEITQNMDELFEDAPHSGIKFDNYDNIPIKVSGDDPPPMVSTFQELSFGNQIMTNIQRAKYVKPTPVQKGALPIALAGRDLMACAQTGSGKTAAFMLPVLTTLINQGLNAPPRSPLALCIAPTRELAVQIYKEAHKFSNGTPVTVGVCYGGVSVQYQASQLERGCHFLVATPGRLQDFVTREKIYLNSIRHLILDEADRMLDMGFGPAIHKLVEQSGMTPKESRQTLMFSATFPDEIQRLAGAFLKPDYLFLAVGRVGGTNLDISQHIMVVNGNDKRDKLHEMLTASGNDRTLVFVELKRVADFLASWLSQNNFPTTSISSDRSQMEREAALRDFRDGRANILVATSVAARGLDIPDVKHVVNYDLPQEIDEYVHRIGRTGRIGNEGKATSFYEIGRDDRLARSLVKVLSEAFQEVPSWLEQAAEDAVGSSYGHAGGKYAGKDHRERGGGYGRNQGNARDITSGMSNMQIQNGPASFQAPRQFSQPQTAQQDNDDDWD